MSCDLPASMCVSRELAKGVGSGLEPMYCGHGTRSSSVSAAIWWESVVVSAASMSQCSGDCVDTTGQGWVQVLLVPPGLGARFSLGTISPHIVPECMHRGQASRGLIASSFSPPAAVPPDPRPEPGCRGSFPSLVQRRSSTPQQCHRGGALQLLHGRCRVRLPGTSEPVGSRRVGEGLQGYLADVIPSK